jgi:hypothetical protein
VDDDQPDDTEDTASTLRQKARGAEVVAESLFRSALRTADDAVATEASALQLRDRARRLDGLPLAANVGDSDDQIAFYRHQERSEALAVARAS